MAKGAETNPIAPSASKCPVAFFALGELQIGCGVDSAGFDQSNVSAEAGHAVTVDPAQISQHQYVCSQFGVNFRKRQSQEYSLNPSSQCLRRNRCGIWIGRHGLI